MPKKRKSKFWKREKEGAKRIGRFAIQAGKELSSIPAFAARELTGTPHHPKPRCTLKKGWFE